MLRKTVFLDRDGVINQRKFGGYIADLSELAILPGAIEAIRKMNTRGWRTVVVTNQRGLATGALTWDGVRQIHDYLSRQAALSGAVLEEFYVCPHNLDENCSCRKPRPGLLDQAYRVGSLRWNEAFLVGDSDSDIAAGLCRGVTTIKIGEPGEPAAHFHADDLAQASTIICRD